jgi:hypothetical protein
MKVERKLEAIFHGTLKQRTKEDLRKGDKLSFSKRVATYSKHALWLPFDLWFNRVTILQLGHTSTPQ